VVAYHCDVRSLTGFDRSQHGAGCNARKGFDPRARCVDFCRRGELLLTTVAPAMRGAFALWT
jgi:hypothetical protein